MKDNNENNENINTIHKSFTSLVDLFEKGKNNNIKKEEKKLIDSNINDNDFIKNYFCCKECYDKFIKVIKKLKDNKIDLSKIDWGKYPADSSNIIVKLVTYYYNLGLQNSLK